MEHYLTFDPRSLTAAGIPYTEMDFLDIHPVIRISLPGYEPVYVSYHANVHTAYVEKHDNFPYTRFRSWLENCGVEYSETIGHEQNQQTA